MTSGVAKPSLLRFVCGLIVCNVRCFFNMASDYPTLFGARVRELREDRGLSQEALADAAELHRTHISLIERGQRSVRLETIERLAIAFGVQPSELLPDIDLN